MNMLVGIQSVGTSAKDFFEFYYLFLPIFFYPFGAVFSGKITLNKGQKSSVNHFPAAVYALGQVQVNIQLNRRVKKRPDFFLAVFSLYQNRYPVNSVEFQKLQNVSVGKFALAEVVGGKNKLFCWHFSVRFFPFNFARIGFDEASFSSCFFLPDPAAETARCLAGAQKNNKKIENSLSL